MFSLESPHRGDSNEYTQHAIINIQKENHTKLSQYNNVCTYEIFPQGLKNEFEKAVVNEQSVFEPLTFLSSIYKYTSAFTELSAALLQYILTSKCRVKMLGDCCCA